MYATTEDKSESFKNLDELLNFAYDNDLDIYEGCDDGINKSFLYSSEKDNNIVVIIDKFDDEYECKVFEKKIKPFCKKFYARKLGFVQASTITASPQLKKALTNLKKKRESYESVIWDLILEHEKLI